MTKTMKTSRLEIDHLPQAVQDLARTDALLSSSRNLKPTKGHKTKSKETRRTAASSSSGLTPEERARSLLLPTTDETEGSVPRERSEGQILENEGQADADSVPSTIDYPENPLADLVVFDDRSFGHSCVTHPNWLPIPRLFLLW